ncbi:protein of unknown function DUF4219, partial [Dillenia turbinata]
MKSDKIVPQLLGLDNYTIWSNCIRSYLIGEDLWEVVTGKEVSQEKDAKALEVIKSSCGFDLCQGIDINEFKSARTAWDQLFSHCVCTPQLVNPPPVLMDDNYETWRNYMEQYLKKLGLWDVVHQEVLEDPKIWEQKNAKAFHHILISCGPNTLPLIFNLGSAKAAWERLASIQKVDPYLPLYHDLEKAGNPMIRQMLESKTVPNELRSWITPYRHTILHSATMQQQEDIVKDLAKKLTPEDLKQRVDTGDTALILAACVGNEKIARYLAESCPELVTMGNIDGDIPLVVAANFGHKSTVWYLYSVTPEEYLNPADPRHDPSHPHGTSLLISCINDGFFDIALDLATRFPKLASGREKSGIMALQMLASKPLAFPSGKELVFWKQWIYSRMPVKLPHAAYKASRGDPEKGLEGQTKNQDMIARVPGGKALYKEKLKHLRVQELLSCIIYERMQLDTRSLCFEFIKIAFSAAENGIAEIIIKIAEIHPEVLNFKDENERNLFSIAALRRQKNVFTLLHRRDAWKALAASGVDKNRNTVLHLVATLVPSSQHDRISGAALQMKRELQWFQEVQKLVQPKLREAKNAENKTPRELFTESHQQLKEAGEKWMKDAATSSSLVAALIVTIM